MGQIANSIIITSGMITIAFISRKIVDQVSYYNTKRANGCEEPPSYPQRLPYGIELYFAQKKRLTSGDGEVKRSKRLFATYGKTLQMNVLGQGD